MMYLFRQSQDTLMNVYPDKALAKSFTLQVPNTSQSFEPDLPQSTSKSCEVLSSCP